MKRAILTPAALVPGPLDELKQWLAITTSRDDSSLASMLLAAIEACEAFTGQMPLETMCEEIVPATRGWHSIATTPVQAILSLEQMVEDDGRSTVDPDDYLFDISSDGCGRINLLRTFSSSRLAVQFIAGAAGQWDSLPQGLKHGIIRLAAHYYRERNQGDSASPPASVVALWQPWRRMRIA